MPAIWSGGPELRRIRLPETLAAGVPMITNRGIAGHGETNVDAPGGLERWLGSNQGRISSTGSAGLGNLWQPALDRSTGRSDRSCRCSPCRLAGGTGMTVAAFTTHAALIAVMQPGSMLNPKPAIDGRWYGPGSLTSAVYTAPTLVLVGYMAHRLRPRLGCVGAVRVDWILIVSVPPKPVKAAGANPAGSLQDTFGSSAATSTAAQCDTCEARAGRHVQT